MLPVLANKSECKHGDWRTLTYVLTCLPVRNLHHLVEFAETAA